MFTLIVVLFLAAFVSAEEEKYTTKFDNLDYDEILHSERLLKNYLNCLLDKGPCTPEGAELRKVLTDALSTGCTKCSDKQKEGSKKVVRYLIENKPESWSMLVVKYDPDGIFKEKFQDEWLQQTA